jgi:hypothetical protein
MLTDDIDAIESDSLLFKPGQLRRRLEALDRLDIEFDGFESGAFDNDADQRLHIRASAIRARLEAVNADLYQSMRAEIINGTPPHMLLHWIEDLVGDDETKVLVPGLAYDYLDDLVAGILQLREPGDLNLAQFPETVAYQPTPVRHILHLIRNSALSPSDTLVDLGSGLGHVPLLVAILTGAQTIGVEFEAAYVARAQECAQSLHLSRVHFMREDARVADLSAGTVFYLFTPFTGSILALVLNRLRNESKARPIRICTFGPVTSTVAEEPWLKTGGPVNPGQVTVFLPCF